MYNIKNLVQVVIALQFIF